MNLSDSRNPSVISKPENNDMTSENNDARRPKNPGNCPEETTLTLFVEQGLPPDEMAETATHLLSCPACAETVKDLAAWLAAGRESDLSSASPEDQAAVEGILFRNRLALLSDRWRTVASAFAFDREVLAAADGQSADQIQQETALRSGFLLFASELPKEHRDAWRAKLAIPASVTADTVLRISVEDAAGHPVGSGTLTFCGVPLAVKDGRCFMPIRTFQENLGKAMVSLKRGSGGDIPGEPVLGGGMER